MSFRSTLLRAALIAATVADCSASRTIVLSGRIQATGEIITVERLQAEQGDEPLFLYLDRGGELQREFFLSSRSKVPDSEPSPATVGIIAETRIPLLARCAS